MPTAAPRIYADFNGLVRGPVDGRVSVVLDTFGSARDLSNAGIVLEEGLALVAYDESDAIEDLEIHGTARYDRSRRGWVVESDERGVMYVPAVDRSRIDPGFHCVRCAHALDGLDAFLRAGACPQCSTPVQASVAAPGSNT